MTDNPLPPNSYGAVIALAKFVDSIQKCPDSRTVASLDASDHITCGDMREILRLLTVAKSPTGETET